MHGNDRPIPQSKLRTSPIHQNPQETRERSYDKLRKTGIPRGRARDLANQVASRAHDSLNKG